jgi:hypothetical protein
MARSKLGEDAHHLEQGLPPGCRGVRALLVEEQVHAVGINVRDEGDEVLKASSYAVHGPDQANSTSNLGLRAPAETHPGAKRLPGQVAAASVIGEPGATKGRTRGRAHCSSACGILPPQRWSRPAHCHFNRATYQSATARLWASFEGRVYLLMLMACIVWDAPRPRSGPRCCSPSGVRPARAIQGRTKQSRRSFRKASAAIEASANAIDSHMHLLAKASRRTLMSPTSLRTKVAAGPHLIRSRIDDENKSYHHCKPEL